MSSAINVLPTVLAIVGWIGVGAFVWFFFEYVLHRFAFHNLEGFGIGSREHLNHHVHATWRFDPVITLAWLGVVLTGIGWSVAATWVLGSANVWVLGVGWIGGYFFYEYHHAQSHRRGPRNDWEAWLRKHHFHHHFGHPLANQNVTIPLWDIVFGTMERPERVRVPRRLAMTWLLDDDGEVRAEYRDDYELVGRTGLDERQAGIDRARAFANLVPTP